MEVTILVDNYVIGHKGMLAEHGFSALITFPEKNLTLLFDTGATGRVLINNIKLTKISPSNIDTVIISHRHYDHTGGIKALLKAREGRETTIVSHYDLFYPAFAKRSDGIEYIGIPHKRDVLERMGARFAFTRKPTKVTEGVIFTGEIPREWGPSHTNNMLRKGMNGLISDLLPDDSALILETAEGIVIITGCGHAGVENIIEYALSITGERRIAGVMGGLHLMDAEDSRVAEVVKYLVNKSPAMIAPVHCTGMAAQRALAAAFGKKYVIGGVGTVFRFE